MSHLGGIEKAHGIIETCLQKYEKALHFFEEPFRMVTMEYKLRECTFVNIEESVD